MCAGTSVHSVWSRKYPLVISLMVPAEASPAEVAAVTTQDQIGDTFL